MPADCAALSQVGLPPMVGMVGVGLLLRNVPGGVLAVSHDKSLTASSAFGEACLGCTSSLYPFHSM